MREISPSPALFPDTDQAPALPPRPLVLRLQGMEGPPQEFTLSSVKATFGSDPTCTVCLPNLGLEAVHGLLIRGPNTTLLRSWGPNTRLNGTPVRVAALQKGDRITLGPPHLEVPHLEVLDLGCGTRETESEEETAGAAEPPLPPAATASTVYESIDERSQRLEQMLNEDEGRWQHDAEQAESKRQLEQKGREEQRLEQEADRRRLEQQAETIEELQHRFASTVAEMETLRQELFEMKAELGAFKSLVNDSQSARSPGLTAADGEDQVWASFQQSIERARRQVRTNDDEPASEAGQADEDHERPLTLDDPTPSPSAEERSETRLDPDEFERAVLTAGFEEVEEEKEEEKEEETFDEAQEISKDSDTAEGPALDDREQESAEASDSDSESPVSASDVLARLGKTDLWKEDAREPHGSMTVGGVYKSHSESDSGDESIEQYMEDLLKRMRGDRSVRRPEEDDAVSPVSPESQQGGRAGMIEPVVVEEEVAEQPPDKLVARSRAPELTANLAAMRQLANESTRAAIETHTKRNWAETAQSRALASTIGAILGGGAAGFAWLYSQPYAFFPAAGAFGMSIYWAGQAVKMRRNLTRYAKDCASQNTPSTSDGADMAEQAEPPESLEPPEPEDWSYPSDRSDQTDDQPLC